MVVLSGGGCEGGGGGGYDGAIVPREKHVSEKNVFAKYRTQAQNVLSKHMNVGRKSKKGRW